MIRMPRGVNVMTCGVLICLLAITAGAQDDPDPCDPDISPPVINYGVLQNLIPEADYVFPTIRANDDCEAEVPDYVELLTNYTMPNGIPLPIAAWANDPDNCTLPGDLVIEQFPPPGVFSLLEDIVERPEALNDGVNDIPAGYRWPESFPDPMGVYILVSDAAGNTSVRRLTTIEDKAAPTVFEYRPIFHRIEVDFATETLFEMPDLRWRVREMASDNCTDRNDITITQEPAPGPNPLPPVLPAGRAIQFTLRDLSGNMVSLPSGRLELVDINDLRPVITPIHSYPIERRFEDAICPFSYDCGPLSYWEQSWECGVPYEDPGARAYDPVTGADLTRDIQVRITPVPDTLEEGYFFTVRYWLGAEDAPTAVAERRIGVRDTSEPIISLGATDGVTGTQYIYRDWPAVIDPEWEEPGWVEDLRDLEDPVIPWSQILLRPFNFVPSPWDDATAMPWRCPGLRPYEERLSVYDVCSGEFDEERLGHSVLVVVVKVRMAGEDFEDGDETFFWGGTLRDLRSSELELPYGRPGYASRNPWYGYRFYYFAFDNADNYVGNVVGNLGYASRHVSPVTGLGMAVVEPREITITCDGMGLEALYDAEQQDRAYESCAGDLTHLIGRTGEIARTPDGYFVPGVYKREYTVMGSYPSIYSTNPWFRTIIVEDTDPEVLLYNESGEEVSGVNAAVIVPWCAFLDYEGSTLQEQADNWAADWWVVQPDYDLLDDEVGGYSAAHLCDSDTVLTSWVAVRGLNVLKSAMIGFAAGQLETALGLYSITYDLEDARFNRASSVRPVLLLEDIKLDLIYDPGVTIIHDGEDKTTVQVECGLPFSLPEVGRIWDGCSGKALGYDTVVMAYDAEGVLLQEVDIFEPSVVTLVYNAIISAQFPPAPIRTVELHIVDTMAPDLQLLGGEILDIECGQIYTELFAVAWDICDGDLTADILMGGDMGPINEPGRYTRTYTVRDSSGNETRVPREINVVDTLPPAITLLGANPMYIEVGAAFVEPGYFADDLCEGNLTGAVRVSGAVDTATPGKYTITYAVEDRSFNDAIVMREVYVAGAGMPLLGVYKQDDAGDRLIPVFNNTPLVETTWECGLPYEDWGARAWYIHAPNVYLPVDVYLVSAPDSDSYAGSIYSIDTTRSDATYYIRYSISYGDNKKVQATRVLTFKDTTPPVMMLQAGPGGVTGHHNLLPITLPEGLEWDDLALTTPAWLTTLRAHTPPQNPIYDFINAPFAYMTTPWDDATAMTWGCRSPYVDPGINVYDACEGGMAQDDVLVLLTRIDGQGVESVIPIYNQNNVVIGHKGCGYMRDVRDKFPELDEAYRYRFYLFAEDAQGQWASASRHVRAQYYSFMQLSGNVQITIGCDGSLDALYQAEQLDRAFDSCDGDISHMILRTGDIPRAAHNPALYIPGVYYRRYQLGGVVYGQREIIVNDFPPQIVMLNEAGEAVTGAAATVLMPWCAFVGMGDREIDEKLANWWIRIPKLPVIDPEYAPGFEPEFGFYVNDRCEDDDALSSAVQVRGIGALADALRAYAAGAPWDPAWASFLITYDLMDARGNSVQAYRPVLLVEDLVVELLDETGQPMEIDPFGRILVDCGGMFSIPDARLRDDCSDRAPDYELLTGLFDREGNPVDPATINPFMPNVYVLVYSVRLFDYMPPIPIRTVEFVIRPVIELLGDNPFALECGDNFVEQGYQAAYFCIADIADEVVVDRSGLNTGAVGVYNVSYSLDDQVGNTQTVFREIQVVDTTPPMIHFTGPAEIIHECNTPFTDPGATALDACDGDLSDRLVVSGDAVDVTTVGAYSIRYSVTDNEGNTREEVRTVNVINTSNPMITLLGDADITHECGEDFVDPGAVADDACEGDITSLIQVYGPHIDATTQVGVYRLTYTLTDTEGNAAAEATRTVRVVDTRNPVLTLSNPPPPTVACGASVEFRYTGFDECEGDISEWTDVYVVEAAQEGDPFATRYTLAEAYGRPGTYVLFISLTDRAGNAAVGSRFPFTVTDDVAPVIALTPPDAEAMDDSGRWIVNCALASTNETVIAWHDVGLDPGFVAMDACEGDITEQVSRFAWRIDGDELELDDDGVPVNFADLGPEPGEYLLVYTVVDKSDNAMPELDPITGIPVLFYDASDNIVLFDAVAADEGEGEKDAPADKQVKAGRTLRAELAPFVRWVLVERYSAPVVTLTGAATLTIECGDPYVEYGAHAWDACGNDISEIVSVGGDVVNTGAPGEYRVTYTATDLSGNIGEAERSVKVVDTTAPVLTLAGEAAMNLAYGVRFVDPPGSSATDACDGALEVTVAGVVDETVIGTYTLTYTAQDNAGNKSQQVRSVTVLDPGPPTITLDGENPYPIECGVGIYDATEATATAFDRIEGVLTSKIKVSAYTDQDFKKVGNVTITYTVENSRGGKATATRTVIVSDTTAPVVTLRGPARVEVDCGKAYREDGAQAWDACQGDMTNDIRQVGNVDANKPGTYEIKFSVTDVYGNSGQAVRTVVVKDNCSETVVGTEGEGEGISPREGETKPEGEGEPEDESGCAGCAGDSTGLRLESLKRRVSDYLLIGMSLMLLMAFAGIRRRF